MWLLLQFLACGGDPVTTDRTFVADVRGPQGTPLEGLLVQTVEAQARTNPEGRVSVAMKPDNRLAHFTVGGTWYRYTASEEDLGGVPVLQIPETAEVALTCPPVACDLTLRWPLGEGFEAQVRPGCAPDREVTLAAVPSAVPQVVCTQGKGREKRRLAVAVVQREGGLAVVEQGAPVQVELRAVEGTAPTDCRVRVGDRVARATEAGRWQAEAAGPVTVSAVCAGVPALPAFVDPTALEGAAVELEWAAGGPTVDVASVAPWAELVVIAAEGAGWTLELSPDETGRIRLPPLAAGPYRVLVRSAEATLPLAASPPEGVPNGVVALTPAGEGQLVGRLTLAEDVDVGEIRVTLEDAGSEG